MKKKKLYYNVAHDNAKVSFLHIWNNRTKNQRIINNLGEKQIRKSETIYQRKEKKNDNLFHCSDTHSENATTANASVYIKKKQITIVE